MEDFETLVAPGTRVAEFNPAGDGVTDDYIDLQAAITTSYTTGLLVFEPGKTYLVATTLTIAASLVVHGNGATILKSPGLNGLALSVTGDDVQIRDLNVDGNLTGGNSFTVGCIQWEGDRGVAVRVVANNSHRGVIVTSAGAVLDAYDCEASSHRTSGGIGFLATVSGLLRTWNCRADYNHTSGFHFTVTAADGCHLDGTANSTYGGAPAAGVKIFNANGTCGRLQMSNNQGYGVYASGSAACSDWSFEQVVDVDSGQGLGGLYAYNTAATSVELLGVARFKVASLISKRAAGYGAALTRDTATSVGCNYCTIIGDIANCGDPAFFLSGNSNHNIIRGTVHHAVSVALSFGEGIPGVANDDNDIEITAMDCTYGVINLDTGSRNNIRVHARDCYNTAPYTSLVRVWGVNGACADNVIRWESANPNSTPPAYIMLCDATAVRNKIIGGFAKDYATAILSDANGTNRVYLDRDYENVATYSASITLDASQASYHKIPVTNGTAFAINAPTNNANIGAHLRVDVFNSSGGAMGVITWNAAFTLIGGAFTNPANTKHRWIDFYWDGTKWVETSRAAADI